MKVPRWNIAFMLSGWTAMAGGGLAESRTLDSVPPAKVVRWIRVNAVPVGGPDDPLAAGEATAIKRFVGDARILALGEPGHGAHEPLVYRNRLIRFLVERQGFTAVALESGLAGGRRVDAYVMGGAGDPVEIARQYLNWTFGELAANVTLLRWLREYNADKSHRAIRFYGADASGGDAKASFGDAGLALDDVMSYLARTIPVASTDVREQLTSFATRFTPEAYADYPPADRATLATALAAADRLFDASRSAMIGRSSRNDYDWAARELLDCRRLELMFRVWPPPQGDRRPGDLKVARIRDRTMADHLRWALEREGPRGRILSFASTGHVAASQTLNGNDAPGVSLPASMGEHLRAVLGDRYRVLIMVSGSNGAGTPPDSGRRGSLDEALAASASPPLFLSIRGTAREGWWGAKQSVRHGFTRLRSLVPNIAADGILYLGRVTCEPRPGSAPTECRGG